MVHVRSAHPDDGSVIRRIYNTEVTGSKLNFDIIQWTAADQDAWLARHRGAYPAVVAVADPADRSASSAGTPGTPQEPTLGAGGDVVLGFGALSRFRSRPAYATTVEDSVYVDRHRRGLGVGRALLAELVRLAAEHGFHTVIARVVGHNEASIALHRACGFEVVGIEKEVGRKHGRWLDVVELQLLL